MSPLKPLTLEKEGRALTLDTAEGQDGKRRVLCCTTTPEEGTLPLIAIERDDAFQLLEWLSRWLQEK